MTTPIIVIAFLGLGGIGLAILGAINAKKCQIDKNIIRAEKALMLAEKSLQMSKELQGINKEMSSKIEQTQGLLQKIENRMFVKFTCCCGPKIHKFPHYTAGKIIRCSSCKLHLKIPKISNEVEMAYPPSKEEYSQFKEQLPLFT